jgi:hypothetical protein
MLAQYLAYFLRKGSAHVAAIGQKTPHPVGDEPLFFSAPPGGGTGKGTRRGEGWGEVFATLIRSGHQRGELMDYTARQIGLFYREAMKAEGRRQAAAIIAANLGYAGGKEAKKAISRLVGE